jgi:hypothetical protein
MTQENPFSTHEIPTLAPGAYPATLAEIQIKDLPDHNGDGTARSGLLFRFVTKGGAVISKLVNASNHEKSFCVSLVKSLAGANQPSGDTVRDRRRFWEFIQKLKGLDFLVTCEPSPCGRFNNLVSAVPSPSMSKAA